jgi:hypothetical protein
LLNPVQGYNCIGIVGLAEVESPLEPFSYKRLLLYSRLGAQIRKDVIYKTPDYPDTYVVFYPASERYSSISTIALAWQLWKISQYTMNSLKIISLI